MSEVLDPRTGELPAGFADVVAKVTPAVVTIRTDQGADARVVARRRASDRTVNESPDVADCRSPNDPFQRATR